MKILFFGGGKYIVPVLGRLKDKLSLVVTTEKDKNEPVTNFCIENKIPYLSVKSLSDQTFKSKLINSKSEVAVLANFGLKVPREVINSFPKGIINIHPSLLPKYRGSTPGQTAILNSDKKSGVSLMVLDDEIDTGAIIDQKEEEILPTDTADSLYIRFFKIGADLLVKNLDKYAKGEIKPQKQDDKKATFSKTLTRQSGYFNLTNPPQREVFERMVRAFYPWPSTWTLLRQGSGGQAMRIKFLPNKRIQVEGKKPINYKDFENGHPILYNKLRKLLG